MVVRLPREDLRRATDQAVEATVTTAAATITAVAAVADGDETDLDPESVTATDTEEEDGGAAPTGGRETGPRAIGIVAEEVVGEIVGRAFLDLYGQKVVEHSVRV